MMVDVKVRCFVALAAGVVKIFELGRSSIKYFDP